MEIKLKDKIVKIDYNDRDKLSARKWHISDTGYVVWRGVEKGRKMTIRLHRIIIKAKQGEIVDHINRDKLDNRRANLRICTQKEHALNQDRVINAKGYWLHSQNLNWCVEYKGIKYGSFATETEAKQYVARLKNGEPLPIKKYTKQTRCKKGHSYTDGYKSGKYISCRTCVLENCRQYYKRKRAKS